MSDYTSPNETKRIADVACPQCGAAFRLTWNDYTRLDRYKGYGEDNIAPQTLFMRGCPSGGIYDVLISCPRCEYEEEL